ICRSPAAEIIFRHMAAAAGRSHEFQIDSAGIIGHHDGSPPDGRMSAALRERNYEVTGNARKIRISDLGEFDLIVTMDETNLDDVRGLDPAGAHHHKIRPFVSYCSRHNAPRVPDPYYGGQRGFDHVIELLEDGCQGILDSLPAVPRLLAAHQEMTSSEP
ncbi:MAG TPA: low molecular weight protein-tyrosine-phosphatase, partial [Luteolibacter sp.]|nr:low molecular weight protein-tyrosine-phosphatase [Luteolibacter sp.]